MDDEENRESEQPVGGQGRGEEVGASGVYDVFSREGGSGNAEIRGEMWWGEGERRDEGYEESCGA